MQTQINPETQALTPLQRAQLRLKELRASGDLAQAVRLTPREKALKNPKSLRAAVTAHCFECVGEGKDPNPRQSVRDCQITSCNLHHVRPWQKVVGKSADQMSEEEFELAATSTELDIEDEEPADAEE